jgi:hypothetical protein
VIHGVVGAFSNGQPRTDIRELRKITLGRYRSGQTGQTVNLLAYAFSGSNPLLPILRPLASSAASYGKPYFGLAGQQSSTRAKYALRSSAAAERRRTFVPSRYTSWKFNFSRPWYVFNSSSGRTSECYCIFILTTCILGWLDHKDTKRNQDRQQ